MSPLAFIPGPYCMSPCPNVTSAPYSQGPMSPPSSLPYTVSAQIYFSCVPFHLSPRSPRPYLTSVLCRPSQFSPPPSIPRAICHPGHQLFSSANEDRPLSVFSCVFCLKYIWCLHWMRHLVAFIRGSIQENKHAWRYRHITDLGWRRWCKNSEIRPVSTLQRWSNAGESHSRAFRTMLIVYEEYKRCVFFSPIKFHLLERYFRNIYIYIYN